jgi:hypothetical protein
VDAVKVVLLCFVLLAFGVGMAIVTPTASASCSPIDVQNCDEPLVWCLIGPPPNTQPTDCL